MLSDRDALLAAIRANPEEDTPRLVLADWLDENGQPERAEFIRLQCEIAAFEASGGGSYAMYAFLRDHYPTGLAASDWTRIDSGVHRLIAMETRAADLLRRHGKRWFPKLPRRSEAQWTGFRRGFAHRLISRNRRKWKGLASALKTSVPAVTLHYTYQEFPEEAGAALADTGLLKNVAALEVGFDPAEGLRELGRHPDTAGVRSLLPYEPFTADAAEALTQTPHWSGLRELDLSQGSLESEVSPILFQAQNLRTLRRLTIDRGPSSIVHELAASGFDELTSLRLANCDLDDDAAETLASCPRLANVRTLDLEGNAITGRGVTALLTSPHLKNVAYLGLDGNPGTGVDAKRLAEATPGSLRLFHAHGCRFNTADVRALSRCPRLRTVWYFDLDENNIGTPAVRELVRGFGKWCPPILWLTYNRIDDRGAELLAKWKAASNLSALHLKYNDAMTGAGVRALLDSRHLANLDALGVDAEDEEIAARIRARFRHHELGY